jgi:hypothetical protein
MSGYIISYISCVYRHATILCMIVARLRIMLLFFKRQIYHASIYIESISGIEICIPDLLCCWSLFSRDTILDFVLGVENDAWILIYAHIYVCRALSFVARVPGLAA